MVTHNGVNGTMLLSDDTMETEFISAAEAGNYMIEVPSAGLVSELGWDLPVDLSIDKWQEFGKRLGKSERSLGWWIGDWWIHGLSVYKMDAKKAVEAPEWTGPTYKTCQKYAACCKKIPLARRRGILPFWQHFELRNLPEEQQETLLNGAVEYIEVNGKPPSVKQLRDQVKANGLADNAAEISRKEDINRAHGLYPLGFCDPPWNKINVLNEMSRKPPLADEAVLFMLAGTDVSDAGALLTGWEFDNVGSIVWILPRKRPTAWTQEEHRLMLIGSRGEIKPQYVPPSTIEASSVTGILNLINEMFPHLTRKIECLGEPINGFDDWRPYKGES